MSACAPEPGFKVVQLRPVIYRASDATACFSRRLCTDERISQSFTILGDGSPGDINAAPLQDFDDGVVGKDVTSGVSPSTSSRMRSRTASEECNSPPSAELIAPVKKYLSSSMPRGVYMNLFAVTRLTVNSCIPIASATVFRLSGRKWRTREAEIRPVALRFRWLLSASSLRADRTAR